MNSYWHKNKSDITKIMAISWPMFLSNLSQPLLGFVDTAVVGHMNAVHFLAGVAIGSMLITQIYWLCGALRMSTTGLSAQAKGAESVSNASRALWQGVLVALIAALIIIAAQKLFIATAIKITNANNDVAQVIADYFTIRVAGAPAALTNMVLVGWLIGQQQVKVVMWIQILSNLLNAVLNLTFVYGFNMGVKGVAFATVITEYTSCIAMLYFILPQVKNTPIDTLWFRLTSITAMLRLNTNMFIRNIALQFCLAFMVVKAAQWGEDTVAINNLLHQFFVFCALGLDAIAYAAEALIGQNKGAKKSGGIIATTRNGLIISSVLALIYCIVFIVFGNNIVSLLTDLPSLQTLAGDYLLYVCILPLLAHWCFLMDGVYVGLSRATQMRNSMIFSAAGVFLPVYYLLEHQQNHGLWIAFLAFVSARGACLLAHFIYLCRRQALTD